jgi:hypothetical protein
MRAGPLLLTTGIEEHRPLGFAGEPIYLNHRKLVAVVASRLGDGAANYFARPEVDETHHRINWHAAFDGEVRRWTELSPDQQGNLTPKLTVLQQRLASLVATLEGTGDQGHAQENFGRALRLALRSPGVECLYVVGDNPVLTLWGFEGGSHRFDTLTFNPAAQSPTMTASDPPPSQDAAPARRPWWHWLLWLLGLLALLLLTLLVLRSCWDVQIPVVEDLLPRADGPPTEEQPLEPVTAEPGTTVVPGGPIVEGDGGGVEAAPQSEMTSDSVPPTGEGVLGEPTPPAGAMPETPTPEAESPTDEATPPGDSLSKPPAPPTAEAPAEEPTPPGAAQEGAQEQPPPSPSADDSAEQTEPLTIPPQGQSGDAKSLGFLEGKWRSDSGLYDKSTGKPLTQLYRFDKNGQGTVVIRRADGVDCGGKAQASRTATGGLRIEEAGPIECPDGKRFAPAVTECTRAEKGQAKCQGTNRAGSSYDVQITR